MELNDLLIKHQIDPASVLVLRHRPFEPTLRKILPWLAAERPTLFNAYQQSQYPKVEKAMTRASHVVSFIGHEAGKALFVGVFKRGDWQEISYDEFWHLPANLELKSYGMRGMTGDRKSTLLFDLVPIDVYARWSGKLIAVWPGLERSWWRWAGRNSFLIDAILPESAFVAALPDWNEIVLSWEELKVLPTPWKAKLNDWRGIYFILDQSDGKGYVGSAYGSENILGRWSGYAAGGHGGNSELRKRDPKDFRFSILERVAPDMAAADVIRIEDSWKRRLHTRAFGLNKN
jgi:hypothetical protein